MFDPEVLGWHLEAGIDRGFLAELAEIRLAVEPRAAELAAHRRSEADLSAMRSAIERMRREAVRQTSDFAEADLELHLSVAKAAGNPFMRSLGGLIAAALRASFQSSAPVGDEDYAFTVLAHERIVEAIAAGEVENARKAMTDVIVYGMRRHGPIPS